jgi:hypothetical protein
MSIQGDAYVWQGVNRSGTASCGGGIATTPELAAIVEDRFRTGWRWLKVERDGILVAAIERNPSTGRRSWWAEAGNPSTPVPPQEG